MSLEEKKDGKEEPKTLMDAEAMEQLQRAEEKARRISLVAVEVEKILIANEFTWGEWGEVVELFSTRIGHVVSNLKIKEPKK